MAVDVPAEFMNFLRTEQERSVDTTLEDRRAVALEFYQGQPFGDEVEGRSQAVTRDVSEVVDYLVVGILESMLASGKIVEFESEPVEDAEEAQEPPQDGQAPIKPKAIDYGEEVTAAIHYQFMKKQDGYRILHDCLKAGLLEKSGIAETYVEPQRPKRMQATALANEIETTEDGPKYQGQTVHQADAADEDWQPGMPSLMWNIIVDQPQPPRFCDDAVPNEFFRVAPDCGADLEKAVYVGKRVSVTLSSMVEMGYDPADLEDVWGGAPSDTVVEQARDSERSLSRQSVGQRPGAVKSLWLDVEYPLWDFDGDGVAERLFVHRIGNVVLKVMPIDEQPYSLWSPFPMQHRLIGQSAADKTMDIQRIRSVLLRQALDSLYLSNSPRTLVEESSMTVDTIDDILTVRPGALIRYKGTAPSPLEQVDTSATSFQAMEMMSAERESRTGVTRQSQGLNPDTMNKTATGLAMNIESSEKIQLYIARNYAEFVMKIFAKRYRLMRQHGAPFRMKIEGEYRTVDPSKWPEEIDMSINVGLGTGSKEARLQYRMSLLGIQQASMQAGLRIVGEEQVYQNIRGLVQDSGIGSPSQYVLDPSTLPPAEPRPDPEMAKVQGEQAQAQAQLQSAHDQAMGKLQLQQQAQQADAQIKAEAAQQELDTKRAVAEQDAALAEARAAREAQLAENRQAFEMDLAERRFAFDQEMARKKHEAAEAAAANDDALPASRPGGSLAE